MKKTFLILSFLIGLSSITFAQKNVANGPKSPDQKAAMMTHKLQKKLNLSTDQASQVNNVMFTQLTRLDSLKTNYSTTNPKSNQLARKDIMLTTDMKMNAILTQVQMKTYLDIKAERKEKMRAKKSSNP